MSGGEHIDFRGGAFHGPVTGKAEQHHHYGPVPTAMSALPPPPAAFTGRERHVRELLDSLDPDGDGTAEAVLVSAVGGFGGVGKTALALHTAHAARVRFPGGVLFANMRGYDEVRVAPEETVLAFLRALGVRSEDLPATQEQRYALYRSALNDREPVLIILDNVSDAGQVTPLLPGSTRHRVLVTSRDSLDSLTARLINLDVLPQDEAVLGVALKDLGDLDAAANGYMDAADIFGELGDRHGEARAWTSTGQALLDAGQFQMALQAFADCDAAYSELEAWHEAGEVRWNIALLLESHDHVAESKKAWLSAADAFSRADAKEDEAKARERAE
ncbi:hypothetical protein [Streptomyces diastatochromogenes]|uniref:hypothetical protein n=1 Tax=Streptomyces diastatochromogenes TaxID=42236 RepID=UPI003679DA7C